MLSDITQCKELFHTAADTAFADIVADTEKSGPSVAGFGAPAALPLSGDPGGGGRRRDQVRSICWRHERYSDRSGPSTFVQPSATDTSTSISPTSIGAPSTSDPMAGG